MTNWENTLVELINDYRPDIDLMKIPHSIAEKGEKRAQVGDLAEAYVHFWLRRIPEADFNLVNVLNESSGLGSKLTRNLESSVDLVQKIKSLSWMIFLCMRVELI